MMVSIYRNILRYIKTSVLSLCITLFFNVTSAKADISDVITILSNLTCETQGIGELLTTPYAHTCIPASFDTMYVSSLLSPGMYMQALLKLKIGYDKLIPGNCLRSNRADPNNPKITFGFCTDYLLIAQRLALVAKAAYSLLTDDDPWGAIKNAWMVDPASYHTMYEEKENGDFGIFIDYNIPGNNALRGPIPDVMLLSPVTGFPWKVRSRGDKICVLTMSFFGWIPVGCKYIAEPFPNSVYEAFFKGEDISNDSNLPKYMTSFLKCSSAGGCAGRVFASTQTLVNISGTIVECLRQMLVKLLVSKDVCVFDDINSVVNTTDRESSGFFRFQVNMQRAVMAFLTLYVILIGINILLGAGELPKANEVIMYGIKLILVIYFSVGININGTSNLGNFDGMTQWIFPLLLDGASEVSSWIMNASPSQLCVFSPSDYPKGMGHLALWDGLDCKITHYLGIDGLMDALHGGSEGDPLSFSIPPYFYLLLPALYAGQLTLIQLALTYPLIVISVSAFLVNAFCICMIAIVILGVLAPIYVPMALFDKTKEYFESWYRLMISFVLQPLVVVGFMTLMFSVYDMGFYGTCRYTYYSVISGTPATTKKIFVIDNDINSYESEDDYKSCQTSLGWILNNPFASMARAVADHNGTIDVNKVSAGRTADSVLTELGIAPVAGMFFSYFSLLANMSGKLIINLLTCCLILYLMNELSGQLAEFAVDISASVGLGSAAMKPNAIHKAGMKGLTAAVGKFGPPDKIKGALSKARDAIKGKLSGNKGKGDAPKPMISGAGGGGSGGAPAPMVSSGGGGRAGSASGSAGSGAGGSSGAEGGSSNRPLPQVPGQESASVASAKGGTDAAGYQVPASGGGGNYGSAAPAPQSGGSTNASSSSSAAAPQSSIGSGGGADSGAASQASGSAGSAETVKRTETVSDVPKMSDNKQAGSDPLKARGPKDE